MPQPFYQWAKTTEHTEQEAGQAPQPAWMIWRRDKSLAPARI
jgi:hypothetical protein